MDLWMLLLIAVLAAVVVAGTAAVMMGARRKEGRPPPDSRGPPRAAGASPSSTAFGATGPAPAGQEARPPAAPSPAGFERYSKKISLIGDGGVGKTSLVKRFVLGEFDDKYIHTIGTNVKKKAVLLQEERAEVALMVWDLQGQRNDPNVFSHMQRSEGAMVVCDVTRDNTFNSIPEWVKLLDKELGGRVPMVFLGNKSDLAEQCVVSQMQMDYLAQQYGASWHFTSARTGENVERAFEEMARALLGRKPPARG